MKKAIKVIGIIAGIILAVVIMAAVGSCIDSEQTGAAPHMDKVPAQVYKGEKFIVTGTAVGSEYETVKVGIVSADAGYRKVKVAAVGPDGKWLVDASDVTPGTYEVAAGIGDDWGKSQVFTVKMKASTVNGIPEKVSSGYKLVITGTAVSHKHETVTAEIHYTPVDLLTLLLFPNYSVETTTVDNDGSWRLEMPSLMAGDYTVYFKVGGSTFSTEHIKVR